MADNSRIEWTDATWNPVFGCEKVSAGCKHCYALAMAYRLEMMGRPQYYGTVKVHGDNLNWSGEVRVDENLLHIPIGWRKPKRIFVCSMADLFHKDVPEEFIYKVFSVMRECKRHTFQVLTKRPERMLDIVKHLSWRSANPYGDYMVEAYRGNECEHIPPNVWLGVSVENQKAADERIPLLLQTPARVRFLSCEPLLGEVSLSAINGALWSWTDYPNGARSYAHPKLDWVICGGESGHNARPMHPDWACNLRDQCRAAGIPFLFKQWGEWFPRDQWEHNQALILPDDDPSHEDVMYYRVGKHKAGRLLDGKMWDEYPQEVGG